MGQRWPWKGRDAPACQRNRFAADLSEILEPYGTQRGKIQPVLVPWPAAQAFGEFGARKW